MPASPLRLAGFELYFEHLEEAKRFYTEILGLQTTEERTGYFAKFDTGAGFMCLERKGSESYPSSDKAVVFIEVTDLQATMARVGRDRFVRIEPTWAALHDPEGHNIVLLQASSEQL
jgi:predicted enzyme related to lactoylglutathione lyase